MSTYRRKPRTVEAVQWMEMGDHPNVFWCQWCHCYALGKVHEIHQDQNDVFSGSWIVTEAGRVSVVKDEEFKAEYEAVPREERVFPNLKAMADAWRAESKALIKSSQDSERISGDDLATRVREDQ